MSTNLKKVKFAAPMQERLLKGINTLADAVGSTLGPKGRTVIIQRNYGPPLITKDGVTVATHTNLFNPIENMGAGIIKQAAENTVKAAGDGTTTSTVLAQDLINRSQALIAGNKSPKDIKTTFDALTVLTLEHLEAHSTPVTPDKLYDIAKISSNNDEFLGQLISDAYKSIGNEGIVTIDESRTGHTFTTVTEGTTIKSGYISPYFATDIQKRESILTDNPLILITDAKLRTATDVAPILEASLKEGRKMLIIADEFEPQVLTFLLVNKARLGANFPVCAVKAPAWGDRRGAILEDLAILLNTKVISPTKGDTFSSLTIKDLGSCESIISRRNETVFIGTHPDAEKFEERIVTLKAQLASETQEYLIEKLQERIASLDGRIATIHVGAPTKAELDEIKDRVEDSIKATKCSIQEGFLPGGGLALFRAAEALSTQFTDDISKVFLEALKAPFRKILTNAYLIPPALEASVEQADYSTSINIDDTSLVDYIKEGIIDPTLVIKHALINAVSAATTLLSTNVAIYDPNNTPQYSPGGLDQYREE